MWKKQGLIYQSKKNYYWNQSGHVQCPVVDMLNDEVWRIYYSTRDSENKSRISYIEVEAGNPHNIIYEHDKPIVDLGGIGTFDHDGMMLSSIVNIDNVKYLYYFGIKKTFDISNQNMIGLIIYDGNTYTKYSDGPILGISYNDPYYVATPYVILDNGIFKCWYMSVKEWKIINDKPEFFYDIKYAFSYNGIDWITNKISCIQLKENEGGISSPCIIKVNNYYEMYYSYRSCLNYKTDKNHAYKIGYAKSLDGLKWQREDNLKFISEFSDLTTFDSIMMCYPNVIIYNDAKYMFYCGNGFGTGGIGYAISL